MTDTRDEVVRLGEIQPRPQGDGDPTPLRTDTLIARMDALEKTKVLFRGATIIKEDDGSSLLPFYVRWMDVEPVLREARAALVAQQAEIARLRYADARLGALTSLEALSERLDAAQGADDLDRRAERAEAQLRAAEARVQELEGANTDLRARIHSTDCAACGWEVEAYKDRISATTAALARLAQKWRTDADGPISTDRAIGIEHCADELDTFRAFRAGEGRP